MTKQNLAYAIHNLMGAILFILLISTPSLLGVV